MFKGFQPILTRICYWAITKQARTYHPGLFGCEIFCRFLLFLFRHKRQYAHLRIVEHFLGDVL